MGWAEPCVGRLVVGGMVGGGRLPMPQNVKFQLDFTDLEEGRAYVVRVQTRVPAVGGGRTRVPVELTLNPPKDTDGRREESGRGG